MGLPLRLLVIEDLPDDAELMILALQRGGLTPSWKRIDKADDLKVALATNAWDAVLSDYTLPEFGAVEALRIVRAIDPDIPFLVVSGTVGEEVAVGMMRAGANDYILKNNLIRLAPALEREVREAENRRARRVAENFNLDILDSLKFSESRYRRLFEAAQDGILIVDALSRRIVDANPFLTDLLGFSRAELDGKELWELGLFQDIEANKTALAVLEDVGYIRYEDLPLLTKDGRQIEVEFVSNSYAVGDTSVIQCNIRDITDRKQAEAAVRASEERFRAFMDHSPSTAFIKDADGRYLYANPVWRRQFDPEPIDWQGKTNYDFWPRETADLFHASDISCLNRDSVVEMEETARTPGGEELTWMVMKFPLWDGGLKRLGGMAWDITARKRAEQRLTTQHAVVSILSQAADLREAAPRLLQAICETARWDVGCLWVVDRLENVLTFVDLWHVESIRVPEFHELSRSIRFPPGMGLPGHVWLTREPIWIVDLMKNPSFRRSDEALVAGLNGGFAFTIEYGNEVLGVAEFFSRESRQPDEELLRMFGSLGSQIGQFIERKRVEAGLRLFRVLIDQMVDSIEVINPENGRYLDVNQTACVAHGYSREEYLSLSVSDLDPIVAARTWEGMRALGQLTGAQSFESLHRRKDGSTYPIEVNFDTVHLDRDYIVAVVRDITERREAEAAVRLRDRAIAASSQGIMITDSGRPDDPLVYISPGFERMTGYSSAEILGRNCRFLQGKDTDHAKVLQLRHAIQAGEPCAVELLNYRKDGTAFWNELSISPVLDSAGQLTHYIGVQSDVTPRRSLEEQFRQAQKMEAIGQLAGGVAHDFNNLLTIINGYSDLLLQTLDPNDPSREMLTQILKAGERSAGLTRQLLAFSRQQVLAPRVLDLNTIVEDTEKMLQRLLGEDIQLTTTLNRSLWLVRADPGQIDQVLMNLAVNARDAMPVGGSLTIETQNVELGEDYVRTHPESRSGPHVLISVADTGCGMPPEVSSRIFEPFFTTKELGKGTGLGLANVYGIVKQSGGHVAVYSEVGLGTTFKVYLPQVETNRSVSKGRSDTLTPPKGNETILLVEDEEGVRTLTRYILAGCGYTVLDAANGNEAIKIAVNHTGPLHLLITDVVMPGAGGRAVARQVIERHPGAKVLFVSGYTDDAVIRHGVLQEGVNFLQKPFSPISLAFKVREVLDTPRTD